MKKFAIASSLVLCAAMLAAAANVTGVFDRGVIVYRHAPTQETWGVVAPVAVFEDFLTVDVDTIPNFAVIGSNTGTLQADLTGAYGTGGWVRLITDETEDDTSELSTPTAFAAAKGVTVEARVAVPTITDLTAAAGFSGLRSGAADLGVNEADDAAYIGFSPGLSANWVLVSVNGGGTPALTDSGIPVVAGQAYRLGVSLDTSGAATFKIDGDIAGTRAAAVAPDAKLAAYAGVATGTTASRFLLVDYINAWADAR